MLTTIARAAVRRVGAGAVRSSTNRVFQSIWHVQRLRTSENTDSVLPSTGFAFVLRRSLATGATASAGASKPKAKKSPKTAVKKTKKKVTAKAKPAKPAKPAKKPATKKKVLTEEEKAEKKAKLRIKQLKVAALSTPKRKPHSTWTVFVSEYIVEHHTPDKKVSEMMAEGATKYKALSPGELESYNQKALLNKTWNETMMKAWIASHTPEQIRVANNARQFLKKRTGKSFGYQLQDNRIPKQPRPAHVIFAQDQWLAGEFKELSPTDAISVLYQRFKELPEDQQQAYRNRAITDKARYAREFKAVFNRDPLFVEREKAATA